jgi:ATP-dependent DNA helicase RecQ
MALTATAKASDIQEMQILLHSETNTLGVRVLQSSFFRENLYLEVRPKTNEGELVKYVKQHTDAGHAGIVYCGMRTSTVQLAGVLKHCGVAAAAYHAGIESAEKEDILRNWQKGKPSWHFSGCV